MENFAKIIQTEWENIWDYVFGRDIEPEPEPDPADPETQPETEVKDSQ